MTSPNIHPTAIVHPEAQIHPSTVIGPYCVIEQDVVMGADNRLDSHVVVKRYTTIGAGNHFYAGSQFGTDPLDHRFKESDASFLDIGDGNAIRECVTISRGTAAGSRTVLGNSNYIMCNVHVAHNCRIGNSVTVGTCTGLGGYAEIDDNAFVSVNAGLHQFSKVGKLAMVAGHTRVVQDVPPFFLVSEFDAAAHGLNFVGLRRAGYKREVVSALKRAYRLLYREGLKRPEALAAIEALGFAETQMIVDFIRASKRGIVRDFPHARAVTNGTAVEAGEE